MAVRERIAQMKETLLGRFGMRKTEAQKRAFIAWACAHAAEAGCDAHIEESGKWIRSRNIVFGDVDRARIIITAHYDTCARLPVSNFATPGNLPVMILSEALLFAAVGVIGWLCGRGIRLALSTLALPAFAAGALGVMGGVLIFLALVAMMLIGPANRHNANDNTSGVLLLLLMMEALHERPGVAFVLFDNEEKGLLGSAAFIKAHPQAARRFLLNLDCVGDGDTLLYTGTKTGMRMPQAKRLMAALEEIAQERGRKTAQGEFPKWIYPSDQMLFPRGTALAALKGKRLLYMDRIHTDRDTVLDENTVACFYDAIVKSIQG